MADPSIKVPANLIPTLREAANYYGIPFSVLAGTIQLGTGWTNNVNAQFIIDVANAMARYVVGEPSAQTSEQWADAAAQAFGGGATKQFRSRLGELYGEGQNYLYEDDRWTYDRENPTPTGTYTTPKFGAVGGNKVTISSSGGGGGSGGSTAAYRPATLSDIYTLFQNILGRPPKNDDEANGWGRVGQSIAIVQNELENSPEGTLWRQYGAQTQEARRWADSISMNLTGRVLDNGELRSVVQNGWNPDQLESYLRAQKYGNTDTPIGQASDVRRAIMDAFKKQGLPDPTEGQINFAIVNHIPAADAEAYAEQTKYHTVWATDPTTFLTARKTIQQIMAKYGIVVAEKDIDTNLVNQAASGKWTVDQMTQAITSGQMPGAPQGTTVDHYTSVKDMADSVWRTYFPTTTMPQSYTNRFLGMTPDQITMFVRSLPSPEAQAAGQVIPVGVWTDAKNVAKQQLAKFGIVGREPTAGEIGMFSVQKLDAEAIAKHYATDPETVAINPGAQYGKTREDYSRDRSSTEKAYASRFGGVSKETLATDAEKAANPTPGPALAEPDWMKAVFKEGYTPAQSSAIFDKYFQNIGAAPSAADIEAFKTRSTTVYSDYVQGKARPQPAAGNTAMPTLPGLDEDKTQKRGFA